jgi:hypothetical protein
MDGMYGIATPMAAHASVARRRGRLGRLLKNGTRRVRITKMTSVCVTSDSTNQPERKRTGPAWKTRSMTAKVMKS